MVDRCLLHLTIIVSEETGQVSVAQNGELSRGLTSAELRSALIKAQNKKVVNNRDCDGRAAAVGAFWRRNAASGSESSAGCRR